MAFLEKYPNKLYGLVLSNTQSIADDEETKKKREATATEVLTNGTNNFINNFMPKALSLNATEQTKLYLKTILASQQAIAIASSSRGMALRKDTSEILANANLPVLIITSDQDILINPTQSQIMHKLAKNSQLVVIANAGHLSNLEQPTQWNKAIIDVFFRLNL